MGIMWFLWLTGSFKCFWCWSSSLCDGRLLPSKKALSCTWLSCPGSPCPIEVSASSENKNDVLQLEDVAFKIWGTPKGFFENAPALCQTGLLISPLKKKKFLYKPLYLSKEKKEIQKRIILKIIKYSFQVWYQKFKNLPL